MEHGISLRVRVTPRAASDAVNGVVATRDGPAIAARVTAAPADHAANAALVKLIAGWLGVPRSRIAIMAGEKSRLKLLAISGDSRDLMGRIVACGGSSDRRA